LTRSQHCGTMYGRCRDDKCLSGYPRCWEPHDDNWQGCYDLITAPDGTQKIHCKTTRECVKTYKTYYKMYRICTYCLYKVCSRCGAEFDYYAHRGLCPHCR